MSHARGRSAHILTRLATLLLVVSIGFVAFLAAGAVAGFGSSGGAVAVHTRVATQGIADLPRGTVAPSDVTVTVRVPDATPAQLRWAAARDLPPGILLVAVLWLLRTLLRSVRDGDPFTTTNVARLRALAAVILIGVPLAGLASSIFAGELATTAGLDGLGTQLTMPAAALLGGMALFVLSEVFASGVRLRDDLEGTI